MLARLAATDGVVVAGARPFVVELMYRGARYTVRLDEPFKRHRHGQLEPEAAAEEVKAALGVPSALALREGPFPRLMRLEDVPPGAAHRACAFDDSLAVVLVWRLPFGHVPLGADELAAWPPGDDPWAAALANLRARTERVGATGAGEGDGLVLRYGAGDGLDAAAVLLPDLLQSLAGWVAGCLHVAIPSRDDLVAFGGADARLVAEVAAAMAAAFEASRERLSPHMYALAGDGRLERAIVAPIGD